MRSQINASIEIKNTDTMYTFFKDKDRSPSPNDVVCQKFNDKIREIINAGFNVGFDAGMCAVMISINFGFIVNPEIPMWRQIPWGRMDDVKQFIVNNHYRYTQIVDPKMHEAIMNQTDIYSEAYKKDFK